MSFLKIYYIAGYEKSCVAHTSYWAFRAFKGPCSVESLESIEWQPLDNLEGIKRKGKLCTGWSRIYAHNWSRYWETECQVLPVVNVFLTHPVDVMRTFFFGMRHLNVFLFILNFSILNMKADHVTAETKSKKDYNIVWFKNRGTSDVPNSMEWLFFWYLGSTFSIVDLWRKSEHGAIFNIHMMAWKKIMLT